MSVKSVNKANFEEIKNSEKPVLLDFYADWCGPCRMVSPIVDEIAEERDDIVVGKINVDAEPELAEAFGVISIPTLLVLKGGAIVNTSSSAGVTGIPECAAYTATKGATITLTRSLAVDYGKYNIRTNCIAPAAILTDMVKASNLNNPAFNNEKFLEMVTPIRRWGTPEDIAAIACWLCSDDASYLNGAIIRADGGITTNGDVNR